MSSTYVTARRFGIVRKGSQTYVAWFCTTYESNITPRTPHESCFRFGSIEFIARHIVRSAQCAQGGSLRRPGGKLTATGLIRTCASGLQHAFVMPDREIDLVPGTGWRDPISPQSVDALAATLDANGFTDAAGSLREHGRLAFNLHERPDLLAFLCDLDRDERYPHVAPWALLDPPSAYGNYAADAVQLPASSPWPYMPRVVELGMAGEGEGRRVIAAIWQDGVQALGNAETVLFDAFNRMILPVSERDAGAALTLTRTLAAELKDQHAAAPDSTHVELDMRDWIAGWSAEAVAQIASCMPGDSQREVGYHCTTLGAMRQGGCMETFVRYPYYEHMRVSIPDSRAEAEQAHGA